MKHVLNRRYRRHGKRVKLELECRTCKERWIWLYPCRLVEELMVMVESALVVETGECSGSPVVGRSDTSFKWGNG